MTTNKITLRASDFTTRERFEEIIRQVCGENIRVCELPRAFECDFAMDWTRLAIEDGDGDRYERYNFEALPPHENTEPLIDGKRLSELTDDELNALLLNVDRAIEPTGQNDESI